ncbi:unnamed protein product [Rotaria sordida]|uniref:GTP-binding protein Di-Ras2 n=1 Tax=Rotaria sordida TaxID=392033 RepID=A0A818KCQ8_9BILA|nr:unnamed protein product [Rotaria sordida]CAF0881850.1 unnamed protein product [Rotaria sordida]CAF0899615.1 unnamed protein product [Rotaria sordida]CAF0953693.1 unnamed protein product [Rotaria sordida]CAF1010102.1 unnamed protein product [Rotaria sordida]
MALDKPNKDLSTPFRVMPDQSTDYRIVVFGSAGVGKTNCVLRFVNGQFRENYIPTVEDTYRQVVSCNKQITTLQITDTTGAHQFPAMQRLSIQKGHAFILAYSITSKQTFEDLKPIYNQIREIKAEQQNETPILLMGCKLDEAACREITENLGKQLATLWSCGWIETSAKTNTNIREAFQELLKLDKKRQFNFNVDQDGHLIEDNSSTLASSSSPSLHAGKRSTPTNSSLSTLTNSGSSPNMTESITAGAVSTRPTTPVLHGNKSNRTSVMSTTSTSTINAKKGSRSTIEQLQSNENSSGSRKISTSDPSANRASVRKCLIM